MRLNYFKKEELEARRNLFESKLDDFSITLLFSGVSKKETADETYYFSVNRNFYYLTQIDQEDSILMIVKTPNELSEYLFVLPYNELKEKWFGIRLKDFQARELSGINNILYQDTFESKFQLVLDELSKLSSKVIINLDLERENKIAESYTTHELKRDLLEKYNNIEIKDIYGTIIEQRMVKSHAEIEQIKAAIRTTRNGLDKILLNIKPGLYEYQLSGLFEYSLKDQGNFRTSFNTIAASGKNATILHYPNPESILKEDELMLFDLGSQYLHYCSDISRTYPISGKYNELQSKVYTAVLNCNKLVINSICPGKTIKELQEIAIKSLTQSLKDLGLISEDKDYIKYYFHNVSHHLGLDTHDPSFREKPLEEGNVITVEPGLYIKEYGIGVRIEDDILVTESGNINLSEGIVKEIKDIEKLIASREKYKI